MDTQMNPSADDFCDPGHCDMRVVDDSYDDCFGTCRVPKYLECNVCGRTEDMPAAEY